MCGGRSEAASCVPSQAPDDGSSVTLGGRSPPAKALRRAMIEYRNHAIRIQGAERWRELFAVAQINLHGRHRKTLLSKKYTDATRAGCRCAVVNFMKAPRLLESAE